MARFGGSAGAGNGAGGIDVVVVVFGGATVIPVPAPTGATVGDVTGSALITTSEPTGDTGGSGTVALTPAATAATTGVGSTRAWGAVVVVSPGCAPTTAATVEVVLALGFALAGLTALPGFFGIVALGLVTGFSFTLTGRGAILIVPVRTEAERRWALAGVETPTRMMPTPTRIEKTASKDFRLTGSCAGRTVKVESSTPGSAFDMRQDYATVVTVR